MRYYRQIVNNQITALYAVENGDVPKNCEEIGEATYTQALNDLAEADKAARENAEKKAEADAEARQKESEARQAKIDDYVNKVKAGTVKIEEVPEEYRTDVNRVINPPKTENERLVAVEEQTANMQSAMDDLMMMVAGTATESEG